MGRRRGGGRGDEVDGRLVNSEPKDPLPSQCRREQRARSSSPRRLELTYEEDAQEGHHAEEGEERQNDLLHVQHGRVVAIQYQAAGVIRMQRRAAGDLGGAHEADWGRQEEGWGRMAGR